MSIRNHRISQFSTILLFLVFSFLVIFSGTSRADSPLWEVAQDNATQPVYSGRIIVKFNKETTPSLKSFTVSSTGLEEVRQLKNTRLSVLEVKDRAALNPLQIKEAVDEMVTDLNRSLSVEYAEPDYLLYIDSNPDDPQFGSLWGLHNVAQTGGTFDADIDAPEAWDLNTGNSDIVVAVIDTGVDYNHEDLAANMWQNPGEIAGNGIDDDGNGYVDDIYGIDAINNDSNPMDDHNHGTHCAGTIGAVGNNGIGVAGVNWDVKIMALKFLSAGGSGNTSDAIECLEYAIMMKQTYGINIKVTSNSWGGGSYSQAMYDAIEAARDADILFVAAAGNDGNNNDSWPHYPSSYSLDNIIAVAATDHNDNLAYFSSYGLTSVDLAAPGVSILSTLRNNSYGSYSGTSMATPHVAGAAALIWAGYPFHLWNDVKTIILDTVDPLSSLSGKVLSEGRLNISDAVIPPGPAIFLTAPKEGTLLDVNQQTEVAWQTYEPESVPYVKIEFSDDGGSTYTTIESSLPNIDTYLWTTPVTASDQCILRISDAADVDPAGITEMFSIHTLNYVSGIATGAHLGGITAKINYSGPISGFAETDPDGQYSLGLLPGTYDVYASAGEFASAIQTVTLPPDVSEIDFDILYPVLSVTPESILESVTYGDTVDVTVTISNPGDADLEINLSGSTAWVQPATANLTIASGGSSDVLVTLDSTGIYGGTHNANLIVTHNDPGTEDPFSIPVIFEIDGERRLTASPLVCDFATAWVDLSAYKTITLNNNGSEATTITVLDSDNAFFTHDAVLPLEVPPFGSASFQIIFTPTEELTYSGTMTIESDAEDNPTISISLAGSGAIPTLTDGLVAYYPFSGNANDVSGNNNNGSVSGAVLTEDREGVSQSAYNFDGDNDYIQVPDSNSLDLTNTLTIATWMKLDSYDGTSHGGGSPNVISKAYSNYEPYRLELLSNKTVLCLASSSSYREFPLVQTAVPINQWTHVAITYNNGSLNFYHNGTLTGTATTSIDTLRTTTGSLYIGARKPSNNTIDGTLDEIRIYNRVLSLSEIQELAAGVSDTVYGTISGAVKEEITVGIYQTMCGGDVLLDTTTTDVDGYYSFNNLSNGWYTIIPDNNSYNFTPESALVQIPQAAPQAYDFIATLPEDTVLGTISGAVKEGITVSVYQTTCGGDVLLDTTTTDVDGYYSFNSLSNGWYTIIPDNDSYNFTPEWALVQIPQTVPQTYDFTTLSIDLDGDGKENYLLGCSNLDGNCDYDDNQYDGNVINVVQNDGTTEELRTYADIDFNAVTPAFHPTRDQTFDYCSNLTWAGNSDWEPLDEHDVWKLASANYTFDINCNSYYDGCSIFSNSWDPKSTWEVPPEPWLSKLNLDLLYNGNWYRNWNLIGCNGKEISEYCTTWFRVREADVYEQTKFETDPRWPDFQPTVICKSTM